MTSDQADLTDSVLDNPLTKTWSKSPVGRVAAPLREQVISALYEAILDFRLKPGQRLIERELIETLDVSRTTVREALRELASDGLITVVPQRGAFVASPSPSEAADMYEARAALESTIIRMFIKRATPDEIECLDHAAELFADASKDEGFGLGLLQAKDKFTDVLCKGSRSAVLSELTDTLMARTRVLRVQAMSLGHDRAVQELRMVVDAIRDQDADRATEIYIKHIRRAKDNALRSLEDTQAGT